jgi:hypothetical protein
MPGLLSTAVATGNHIHRQDVRQLGQLGCTMAVHELGRETSQLKPTHTRKRPAGGIGIELDAGGPKSYFSTAIPLLASPGRTGIDTRVPSGRRLSE